MKRISALAGLASLLVAGATAQAQPIPANIAAAVANPDRPDADRIRDADRKPAEDLAFAGVRRVRRSPTSSPPPAISAASSQPPSARPATSMPFIQAN